MAMNRQRMGQLIVALLVGSGAALLAKGLGLIGAQHSESAVVADAQTVIPAIPMGAPVPGPVQPGAPRTTFPATVGDLSGAN